MPGSVSVLGLRVFLRSALAYDRRPIGAWSEAGWQFRLDVDRGVEVSVEVILVQNLLPLDAAYKLNILDGEIGAAGVDRAATEGKDVEWTDQFLGIPVWIEAIPERILRRVCAILDGNDTTIVHGAIKAVLHSTPANNTVPINATKKAINPKLPVCSV